MVLKFSIALALLWQYQISRSYERVKLSGCLHEGRKRNQTGLRFQYALNFQTCSWSFFSSYLNNSPIRRYQSVLNLKPVCRIGGRFHPYWDYCQGMRISSILYLKCVGTYTHSNLKNRNIGMIRSSHPEVFLGKGALKICSKFTGEHPCRSAISIKLLWTAASENNSVTYYMLYEFSRSYDRHQKFHLACRESPTTAFSHHVKIKENH